MCLALHVPLLEVGKCEERTKHKRKREPHWKIWFCSWLSTTPYVSREQMLLLHTCFWSFRKISSSNFFSTDMKMVVAYRIKQRLCSYVMAWFWGRSTVKSIFRNFTRLQSYFVDVIGISCLRSICYDFTIFFFSCLSQYRMHDQNIECWIRLISPFCGYLKDANVCFIKIEIFYSKSESLWWPFVYLYNERTPPTAFRKWPKFFRKLLVFYKNIKVI